MCSSYPENIPDIIHLIADAKPKSVLDLGMGNGKYGFLIREYFYKRAEGSLGTWPHVEKVDGLDVFNGYIKPHHSCCYDSYSFGNALEIDHPKYDLYLAIDTLEHWPKDQAHALLEKLLQKGNVLVSTPKDIGEQGASHGNEWERHISQWYPGDFDRYHRKAEKNNGPSLIYLLGNH